MKGIGPPADTLRTTPDAARYTLRTMQPLNLPAPLV